MPLTPHIYHILILGYTYITIVYHIVNLLEEHVLHEVGDYLYREKYH